MKPRILWVNECSVLKTGYATYGNEVLRRLHAMDKYQLAEHAIYMHHSDPRVTNLPWVVYGNTPDPDNEAQVQQFNSNSANQFGEWRFEDICIDFKPHIVMDIRDFWMCSFENRSTFRPYYNWVIMPTVDAFPQNEEWLSTYADADGAFTYQDWSKKVLDHEGGNRIKTLGAASPAADEAFKPMDQTAIKRHFGLENYQIIGTVMRNQRRKLYPDLFAAFKFFLDDTGRKDILLYCHTSYPDMGWDIPKLLLQYDLTSKVLFTYICQKCHHIFPNHFSDIVTTCPKCANISAGMSNVQSGVDNNQLAGIYNMFDLYIQYANSEGFGMPMVEAAACAIPVMAIDYSAMTDVVRKISGIPLRPATLSLELETGCYRAVPDNGLLIEELKKFFALDPAARQQMKQKAYQSYHQNYSWDTTAKKWADYFDGVDIDKYEKAWRSPPKIHDIPTDYPKNINNKDFATWLITAVLNEPRFINTYMESRLIRDLNYNTTSPGLSGMYFNEQSAMFNKPNWQKFDQEIAFKHFIQLGRRKNNWENKRWQSIQAKQ